MHLSFFLPEQICPGGPPYHDMETFFILFKQLHALPLYIVVHLTQSLMMDICFFSIFWSFKQCCNV